MPNSSPGGAFPCTNCRKRTPSLLRRYGTRMSAPPAPSYVSHSTVIDGGGRARHRGVSRMGVALHVDALDATPIEIGCQLLGAPHRLLAHRPIHLDAHHQVDSALQVEAEVVVPLGQRPLRPVLLEHAG